MLGLILREGSHRILLIYWFVPLLPLPPVGACNWVLVGVVIGFDRPMAHAYLEGVSVDNYK